MNNNNNENKKSYVSLKDRWAEDKPSPILATPEQKKIIDSIVKEKRYATKEEKVILDKRHGD